MQGTLLYAHHTTRGGGSGGGSGGVQRGQQFPLHHVAFGVRVHGSPPLPDGGHAAVKDVVPEQVPAPTRARV